MKQNLILVAILLATLSMIQLVTSYPTVGDPGAPLVARAYSIEEPDPDEPDAYTINEPDPDEPDAYFYQ